MTARTLRGQVAVVGVGETTYYRHGQAPEGEFRLALKAVLAACADAGLDPRELDGFVSFGAERSESTRLATAIGARRMSVSSLQWGGGGGGCCAAVASASAAIVAGLADCVVVYRSLAQGRHGRFGQSSDGATVSGERAYLAPYGVLSPPQRFAMQVRRFMHEHGVRQEALRAIALASNRHAQSNPRAVMAGRPVGEDDYDASRWIAEPFHLFDCCMENDGAAAVLLVSAERARDFAPRPAYVLGAAVGAGHRAAAHPHNWPDYAGAGFRDIAPALYRMAGVGARDVGSVQSYDNFSGGVAMSLCEHGFFDPAAANDFLVPGNLMAEGGRLPLNTSGGNLAECYMQGLELVIEAVRQVRGTASCQAPRHDVALVVGAPMVAPTGDLLLGSEATL